MIFNKEILNKFTGKQLRDYMRTQITNSDDLIDEEIKDNNLMGMDAISMVLNNFISELDLNKSEDCKLLELIETDLFMFLFYQDQQMYYYKNIVPGKEETSRKEIDYYSVRDKIEGNSNYKKFVDRKLYDYDEPTNNRLVSVRFRDNEILMLFDYGRYETPIQKTEKSFFVSLRLDFKYNIASVGYKHHLLSKIKDEDKKRFNKNINGLINEVVSQVDKIDLGIDLKDFEIEQVETSLYKLFKEESDKALELIKDKVIKSDTENRTIEQFRVEADKFLTDKLDLVKPEYFIDKAIDIKYQDRAFLMSKADFIDIGGYIFGFGFVEKQVTRSENKSDDRDPIYQFKLFWNLKDIISERKKVSGLSLYWRFNYKNFNKQTKKISDIDATYVELEYRSKNKKLIIHYFVDPENSSLGGKNWELKKRREDYAIFKIIKYLRSK